MVALDVGIPVINLTSRVPLVPLKAEMENCTCATCPRELVTSMGLGSAGTLNIAPSLTLAWLARIGLCDIACRPIKPMLK